MANNDIGNTTIGLADPLSVEQVDFVGEANLTITGCSVHHGDFSADYFPLVNVGNTDLIFFQDVNSLKNGATTLSNDFKRGPTPVVSVAPSFTNKAAGEIISLAEWSSVRNTLLAWNANLAAIDTNTPISASFYNSLVSTYEGYKSQCLCNSNCACNADCSCNSDCGCNYSDKRLKKDIEPLDNADLIHELNIYHYNYNTSRLPQSKQYGVMAQELLEQGYDEFVSHDTSGFYQVEYIKLIPLLIKEAQDSKQRFDDLLKRIEKLEDVQIKQSQRHPRGIIDN